MNDRIERPDPAAAKWSGFPAPLEKPNIYGSMAGFSARRPYLVILIYVALAAASLVVAALTLEVDTNPNRMIAGDIEFRKDFNEFSAAFPALESNFVVTAEAENGAHAREVARSLAAAFKASPDMFTSVHAPGTGPFFDEHGILTQVAGNRMTTIKLIPPLGITPRDVDWFVDAFDQVMAGLHRFPGPAWDTLSRIAKNVLAPAAKRTKVSAR